MKVSVIGATGWVGKAMLQLFPHAYSYSRHVGTREEANKGDVAFICVPSPLLINFDMNSASFIPFNGKLDTSTVEECIAWCTCPLIVVRSTVNPGDCDRWTTKYGKRIMHQPEYLGETPSHPLLNQKHNQFIIIGGDDRDCKQLIELYATTYNANIKIRQVTRLESEVIKLTENRAIAFKVMQCQELYDACTRSGLNYYKIRDAVYGDDPRFNLWFTFIYPNKRGFNSSKCLVKDVPAWCAWAKSVGINPVLTQSLVSKSNEYQLQNIKE